MKPRHYLAEGIQQIISFSAELINLLNEFAWHFNKILTGDEVNRIKLHVKCG